MIAPAKKLFTIAFAFALCCLLAPSASAVGDDPLGGFLIVQPNVHDHPVEVNFPLDVTFRFTNGEVRKTFHQPGEYEVKVGPDMGEPVSASVEVVDLDFGNSTVLPPPHKNALVGFYPEEPPMLVIPIISIEITITVQRAHS